MRMRLARWIAPRPIMWDPFPGEDGVFIVTREKGTMAAFRADKFRMKSRTVLNPRIFQYDPDRHFGDTHRTKTTFVGTLASR